MFKVNVQNVTRQLQRWLSVACAIHWSHCQSLPDPDSPIPRHAGAALPRPWSGGACKLYTRSCRIPTPSNWWGSDLDCSAATARAESGLRAVRGRPLPEQRLTLPVASILLSTVLTF